MSMSPKAPPAMADTHCPRCAAPMVRVREGGRYVATECAACAWANFGMDPLRDGWPWPYDSRDWRRLRRWRAVRGLVTP